MWVSKKAWDSVSQLAINRCWEKGLPNTHHAVEDDDDEDGDFSCYAEPAFVQAVQQLMPEDLAEASGSVDELMSAWATADDECPVSQELTDTEIVAAVVEEEEDVEEPVELNEPVVDTSKIAHSDALKAIEKVMLYYEQQGNALRALQLQPLVRETRKQVNNSQKQCKISEFFNQGR